jgi:putative aldouronate transport system permease protein
MIQSLTAKGSAQRRTQKSYFQRLKVNFVQYRWTYLMLVPVLAYYIIFHYGPLYGVQIAFKDFSPGLGIWKSKWVGFTHFISFFKGVYAKRTILNTLAISIYSLIFAFPVPIILALLLDEVKNLKFKKTIQTITYLPHFISLIVIAGMITDFCSTDGLFNHLLMMINPDYAPQGLLGRPELFRLIYIGSDIWQGAGWNSIIYLAALSGVDTELYEAVTIDGGNRFHRVLHVSIPSILPTVIIMLILRIGSLMSVGFDKIILLYNEATYKTADVISSYVYRRGLLEFSYSFSAAVGLFNNVINFILVNIANIVSRKVTETSLW